MSHIHTWIYPWIYPWISISTATLNSLRITEWSNCRLLLNLYYSTMVAATHEASGAAYKYGDSVTTRFSYPGFRSAQGQQYAARGGLLAVPQRSFYGQCSQTTPVRFLQDSSSSCVVPLTSDSCSASGTLSAGLYSSSAGFGTVDVLDQPGGRATTMNVSFVCMEKSDFDEYSRAVTSANALHRSYSLFADCSPDCRPPSSGISHPEPPRSVIFTARCYTERVYTTVCGRRTYVRHFICKLYANIPTSWRRT